jgi:hypothetical protein
MPKYLAIDFWFVAVMSVELALAFGHGYHLDILFIEMLSALFEKKWIALDFKKFTSQHYFHASLMKKLVAGMNMVTIYSDCRIARKPITY